MPLDLPCATLGAGCRGCPDCQGTPFDAETDAALRSALAPAVPPCSHCGADGLSEGACGVGGCPLGLDL